jgi:hypothetical protein
MSTLLDLDSPELTDQVRKRLSTILHDYACPPTHEGWRQLALLLLVQHTSEFRSEKAQLTGTKNYGALLWMKKLICEKPEMKEVTAANEVAKRLNADKTRKHKVMSKTLQNQFAKWKDNESSEVARTLKRYEALWNALMKAAIQLEQRSYEDEPHYYYLKFQPR